MSELNDPDATLEETYEALYRQGATDGLPVIPPTDTRVEEMLRGTDRNPEAVIGELGNAEEPITVRQLASNAVMAGCLPTHMPVLLAGAEALADPESGSLAFSVSTTGWAYFWTINGPIRHDIDIQCGGGAWGPGFRANRTIGRALGLAYKNTTRLHPGEKDMAVFGNPFKFSLVAGEYEEKSPWDPFHATRGFDAEESAITLAGPSCYITWTPYRNNPEYILEGMVYHMDPYMTGSEGSGKTIWQVVCPYSAEQLGEAGLTREDVKEYICENSYVPARKYSRGKYQDRDLERDDPGEIPSLQLPQVSDPDAIKLLVLGGPGTVNATIGPSIGSPVTKGIETPSNWEALIEEYRIEHDWGPSAEYY